jgi:excisionase family DNA binding protein
MSIYLHNRGRDSEQASAENKRKPVSASATSTIKSCGASRDDIGEIPRRLIHSPRETQTLLGVSHAQVYRLIAAGRLEAIKIGARTGITRQSIEAVAAGEA